MLPGHRNNAKTSCRRGRESVQWGWGSVDPGLTPTRSGEPTAAGSLVGGRGGAEEPGASPETRQLHAALKG